MAAFVYLAVLCVVQHCSGSDTAHRLVEGGATRTLAVVGGGLAGASVAYHAASSDSSLGIAVFDAAEPGSGGASAAAAGLLHPLTTRGGLIWRGAESFASASDLVMRTQARALADAGQHERPMPPFCFSRGVLRVARSEAQAATYKASVQRALQRSAGADAGAGLLSWVDETRARELIGAHAAPADCAGGVWCPRGLCVDAPAYLRALWATTRDTACCALWCREELQSVTALCAAFDIVVVAVGAASASVRGLEAMPITLVRGQTLCWPNVPAEAWPSVGVLGGQYLVPLGCGSPLRTSSADESTRVVGGATFEPLGTRRADSDGASASALAELRAQLEQLWPASTLDDPRLYGSGVRAMPPRTQLGSVPLTGRMPRPEHRNAWYVTGLGGRGLLYHAELGRTVALAALTNDEGALLVETRSRLG